MPVQIESLVEGIVNLDDLAYRGSFAGQVRHPVSLAYR